MARELMQIHPPITLDSWWWLVAAGLAIVGLVVLGLGIWRWQELAPPPEGTDDSLERLRDEALSELDGVEADDCTPQVAGQRMVQVTRAFIGTASNTLVDFSSATQLRQAARRDPRLAALSQLVDDTLEELFSPTATPDLAALSARAREVIRSWR